MSGLSIKAIRDNLTLGEYVEVRTIYEGIKIIESELPFQIGLLYKIGFIEGKRSERARRQRRRMSEWKTSSLINEICRKYDVKAIPFKEEDVRHNIDIICKDGTLFYVENLTDMQMLKIIQELPQALGESKDKGFVVFNENGMPEDWRKGGVSE